MPHYRGGALNQNVIEWGRPWGLSPLGDPRLPARTWRNGGQPHLAKALLLPVCFLSSSNALKRVRFLACHERVLAILLRLEEGTSPSLLPWSSGGFLFRNHPDRRHARRPAVVHYIHYLAIREITVRLQKDGLVGSVSVNCLQLRRERFA